MHISTAVRDSTLGVILLMLGAAFCLCEAYRIKLSGWFPGAYMNMGVLALAGAVLVGSGIVLLLVSFVHNPLAAGITTGIVLAILAVISYFVWPSAIARWNAITTKK